MKKSITLLAAVLLIMAGCGENKQSTDDFIIIDVTASYPKKELILQDFLDVEYIKLETNDEFITSCHVQAISKDIIIVKNTRVTDGDIFIFDRKGKAMRKINRKGQSGEEYTVITSVILDEDNGEIFVNCGGLRKVFVYDMFGNFKLSFNYADGKDESSRFSKEIYYNPIYNFDRDYLICQDNASGRNYFGRGPDRARTPIFDVEPRNIFLIVSKQDGRVSKEIQIPFETKISQMFLSDDEKKSGLVYTFGITPYRDRWILTEPSSDTIYSYSPDHNMTPFIVRTPSVQSMNPETFLFPGVMTDRYYFLQTVKKEYDETEPWSNLLETELAYDRQERKTFECIVYNSDFKNKRPVKGLVSEIHTLTIINDNEISFLERIEAHELVEAYEKGELTGQLKEIAAGLEEDSNAVLMLAKYKKNDSK